MLFHVTHTHTWETCPYDDPDRARDTFGKVMAEIGDSDMELVGAFVDAPAHTTFFVLEANSAVQIEHALAPIFKIGSAATRPVVDFADVLGRVTEAG